jgi:hypothetical protein
VLKLCMLWLLQNAVGMPDILSVCLAASKRLGRNFEELFDVRGGCLVDADDRKSCEVLWRVQKVLNL